MPGGTAGDLYCGHNALLRNVLWWGLLPLALPILAFLARLRSRRSFTASSRARFACVCWFRAAIRSLPSL